MNVSQIQKNKSGQAKAAAIQLVLIILSFLPVLCLNWVNTSEERGEENVVARYEYIADYNEIRP